MHQKEFLQQRRSSRPRPGLLVGGSGGPPFSASQKGWGAPLTRLTNGLNAILAVCGVDGFLVSLPLILLLRNNTSTYSFQPLHFSLLLWALTWAVGTRILTDWAFPLRHSKNQYFKEAPFGANGKPPSSCLKKAPPPFTRASPPPSYLVGIFLLPLFFVCCLSPRFCAPDNDGGPPGLAAALPTLLSTAGLQAAFMRRDLPYLPQLIFVGLSWALYAFFLGAPKGPQGPPYPWLGLSTLISHTSLMRCWQREGREALTFTEASILSQLLTAVAVRIFGALGGPLRGPPTAAVYVQGKQAFDADVVAFLTHMYIILLLLLCLCCLGALLLRDATQRAPYLRFVAAVFLLATGAYLLFGGPLGGPPKGPPLLWLLSYVVYNQQHLVLLLLLLLTSTLGLFVAFFVASGGPPQGADGRESKRIIWLSSLRKFFHFLLVLNILLLLFSGDLSLLLLIEGSLLWLLIATEALRISYASSLFSRYIRNVYNKFANARDANGLVLSHIYLVLGVAGPFLIFAGLAGTSSRKAPTSELSAAEGGPLLPWGPLWGPLCLLGLVLVGCGDSLAAVTGTRCASPVLPSSRGKTLGGLLAFVVSSGLFGLGISYLLPKVIKIKI